METPKYTVQELVEMLGSHPHVFYMMIQSTDDIRQIIDDFLCDCCTEDESDPMLLSDQIFDRFWNEEKKVIVNLEPPSEYGWPLEEFFYKWMKAKLEEYKLEY